MIFKSISKRWCHRISH